jgi:hypothetical protein
MAAMGALPLARLIVEVVRGKGSHRPTGPLQGLLSDDVPPDPVETDVPPDGEPSASGEAFLLPPQLTVTQKARMVTRKDVRE